LPDISDMDGINNAIKHNHNPETVEVSPFKETRPLERNASTTKDDGEGVQPDIGSSSENGDDSLHPIGHNNSTEGGYGVGDESSGIQDGDNVVMKRTNLAGIRYKIIALDKKSGKYRISFIAPKTYDNCYLNLIMVQDEITNMENVKILNMICNGTVIASTSSEGYGPFKIENGCRIVLDIETKQNDYFASEVRIYASEK